MMDGWIPKQTTMELNPKTTFGLMQSQSQKVCWSTTWNGSYQFQDKTNTTKDLRNNKK